MAKFKVGDRVRRLTPHYSHAVRVGHEYVVSVVEGYEIKIKGQGYFFSADEFEFVSPEPVKPMVKYLVLYSHENVQLYNDLETAITMAGGRKIYEVAATHESKSTYVRTEV